MLTMLSMWLLTVLFLCIVKTSTSAVACKIQRRATKWGFHRDVTTSVTLTNRLDNASANACNILLVEQLPTGMYADRYQLKAGEDFGGPKTYSSMDMNVEQPEYLSSTHTLYIFGDLALSASNQGFHWSVTVPLHLRYHRPQLNRDTAMVRLGQPAVLLRCSDGNAVEGSKTVTAPCNKEPTEECQWRQVECQGEDLYFHVPVGRQEHQAVAVWGTLIVTVGAMLYLCYILFFQKRSAAEPVGKKSR